MARLIRREFRTATASVAALSFVADVKVSARKWRRSYWAVPQTDDYGEACNLGRQYACELIQFLKDNPSAAGSNIIGELVDGMAACQHGAAMRGYGVGFLSVVEVLLHRAATREDHWAIVQGVQDRFDAIDEARKAEALRNDEAA